MGRTVSFPPGSGKPPLPPGLPWDEQLKLRAFDLFDRLTEYPGLGAFLHERPLTPAVRKNYSSAVDLFRRAGLDEHEAELAHATYHTFMFGLMGMEYRFRPAKRQKHGVKDADAVVAHATTQVAIWLMAGPMRLLMMRVCGFVIKSSRMISGPHC